MCVCMWVCVGGEGIGMCITGFYYCSFDNLLGALYKLKNLYELTNQYKHLYEVSSVLFIVDSSSMCVHMWCVCVCVCVCRRQLWRWWSTCTGVTSLLPWTRSVVQHRESVYSIESVEVILCPPSVASMVSLTLRWPLC